MYIKKHHSKNCNCKENCNCHKKPHNLANGVHPQRFGDSTFGDSKADNYTTLEEHFENFGEMAAENFGQFGLIRRLLSTKQEKRNQDERKAARQVKRMSRLTGNQAVKEAQQQAKIQKATLQATQQADNTNQLQSQVQPSAAPISAAQTPMASSSEEGAPSYATLPMQGQQPTSKGLQSAFGQKTMETEEEQPTEADNKTPEAVKEATKPKTNITIYIIISVALIGGYMLLKKK